MTNEIQLLGWSLILGLGKEYAAIVGVVINEIYKVMFLLMVHWRDRCLQVGADDSTSPVNWCVVPAVLLRLAILVLFSFGACHEFRVFSICQFDS
jgi:hypothetical protein